MIIRVGRVHDWTKIAYIKEFHADFSAKQNGKRGDFKKWHWYKDIHLQERHHVTDRCPDDVNLIDLLERIADSVTAGMARSGEVYDDDIPDDIIIKAYHNTFKLLKDQIEVNESENNK